MIKLYKNKWSKIQVEQPYKQISFFLIKYSWWLTQKYEYIFDTSSFLHGSLSDIKTIKYIIIEAIKINNNCFCNNGTRYDLFFNLVVDCVGIKYGLLKVEVQQTTSIVLGWRRPITFYSTIHLSPNHINFIFLSVK